MADFTPAKLIMTCLALHELGLNSLEGLSAVDRVSFSIETGANDGLIGPTTGKTSILNCFTGLPSIGLALMLVARSFASSARSTRVGPRCSWSSNANKVLSTAN